MPQRLKLSPSARAEVEDRPPDTQSVRDFREWIGRRGWTPRHGGGYERGGDYAEMVIRGGEIRLELRSQRAKLIRR